MSESLTPVPEGEEPEQVLEIHKLPSGKYAAHCPDLYDGVFGIGDTYEEAVSSFVKQLYREVGTIE